MNNDKNGHGMIVRALSPAQCQAVAAALGNGVAAADLAAEYGVSKRTIYRAAILGRDEWIEVTAGDWVAQFVLTQYGPVRCTAWYPR
jgi:hypothetical protein